MKAEDMRMFDTEIFSQEWFSELTPVQKLVYIYMLMKCDCAGVFEINMRRLNFDIGGETPIARDDIFNLFGRRVVPIGDYKHPTKALIPDFIPFHYGNYIHNDRRHPIHRAVVRRLKAVGISLETVCELATKKFDYDCFDDVYANETGSAVQTELKIEMHDVGKEIAKNTEGVEAEESTRKSKRTVMSGVDSPYYKPTLEEVKDYFSSVGTSVDADEFWSKYESVGWVDKNGNKIKSWKRCLVTWERFRKRNSRGDNWRGGSKSMSEEANRVL